MYLRQEGCWQEQAEFIQTKTRSTIWQPILAPVIPCSKTKYCHTKYLEIEYLDKAGDQNYECEFSAKHIFQQGFLSRVLFA